VFVERPSDGKGIAVEGDGGNTAVCADGVGRKGGGCRGGRRLKGLGLSGQALREAPKLGVCLLGDFLDVVQSIEVVLVELRGSREDGDDLLAVAVVLESPIESCEEPLRRRGADVVENDAHGLLRDGGGGYLSRLRWTGGRAVDEEEDSIHPEGRDAVVGASVDVDETSLVVDRVDTLEVSDGFPSEGKEDGEREARLVEGRSLSPPR
jgi:hypothetical protein